MGELSAMMEDLMRHLLAPARDADVRSEVESNAKTDQIEER